MSGALVEWKGDELLAFDDGLELPPSLRKNRLVFRIVPASDICASSVQRQPSKSARARGAPGSTFPSAVSPDCVRFRIGLKSNPRPRDAVEPLRLPLLGVGCSRFSTGAGGNGTWTNEPVEIVELDSAREWSSSASVREAPVADSRVAVELGFERCESRPEEVGRPDEVEAGSGAAPLLGEPVRCRLSARGLRLAVNASQDSSASWVPGERPEVLDGDPPSATLSSALLARRTVRFLSLGSGLRPGGTGSPGGDEASVEGSDEDEDEGSRSAASWVSALASLTVLPESRIESNSEGEMRDSRRCCFVAAATGETAGRGWGGGCAELRERRLVAAENMRMYVPCARLGRAERCAEADRRRAKCGGR